jgi:hypothetical protein
MLFQMQFPTRMQLQWWAASSAGRGCASAGSGRWRVRQRRRPAGRRIGGCAWNEEETGSGTMAVNCKVLHFFPQRHANSRWVRMGSSRRPTCLVDPAAVDGNHDWSQNGDRRSCSWQCLRQRPAGRWRRCVETALGLAPGQGRSACAAAVEGCAACAGRRSWTYNNIFDAMALSKRQTTLFGPQVLAELPLTWLIRLKTQAPASFIHSFDTNKVRAARKFLYVLRSSGMS